MPELVRYEGDAKAGLPPVLHGSLTPDLAGRVGEFYSSVAAIFEAWVNRRKSGHTQRAYRGDVIAFVQFNVLYRVVHSSGKIRPSPRGKR